MSQKTARQKTEGRNMIFKTTGDKSKQAILFFHAMGVTGDSSMPVAENLAENYYCILPTSTVYCAGQTYRSKQDEVQQITTFLKEQFAQIGKTTRKIMVPFLYLAIKSLYWSKGKTLKKIMWCDDEQIKPYFIEAGKQLTYKSLSRQLSDSLEDKPFPQLPEELQTRTFWEFGNKEDHFKYRDAVMQTYKAGNFPVFDGFNHMQYQIRDPKGFAQMLMSIIETNKIPEIPFLLYEGEQK